MNSFKLKRRDGGPEGSAARRSSPERSRRAVIGYVIALAAAVLALILLSYFIHQRDTNILTALHEQSATAQQNVVKLQEENRRLVEENKRISTENGDLQTRIGDLETAAADADQRIGILETELDEAAKKYDVDTKNLRSEYDTLLQKYNELTGKIVNNIDGDDPE